MTIGVYGRQRRPRGRGSRRRRRPRATRPGRASRSRSMVSPVASARGAGARHGLRRARARRRPRWAGVTRAMPGSAAAIARGLGHGAGGADDLQRARRARAEGRRHLLVALARGVARGDDLDRRHAGLQAEDRDGQDQQRHQGREPVEDRAAPEPLGPGGEPRRAVLAAVHPRQGELVDPADPSLPSTAGSRVSVAARMKATESMMPSAIERNAGLGTSMTAESEIRTVTPENRTALPAVSIVSPTASSTGRLEPNSAPGSGPR